jgi:hypothetical protein
MSETTGLPGWLMRTFPDAEQWKAEGPHRYSARITRPAYGAGPGDWLLVAEDGMRYRTQYVTAEAVEFAAVDVRALAFELLERDLIRQASDERTE